MLTVFKNLKSYFVYIFTCLKCNIKSSYSNKKSFYIQTISMFVNNCVWLVFWLILFNNKGGNINGVVLNDILYLWSVPVIGFGICFLLFGGVEYLSADIANSNIDHYICKPKHSLISILTSKSRLSAMGDIIYGLVMGLFAVGFNPLKYLMLILLGILTGIGFIAISVIIRSLAFYFGNITKAGDVYIMSLLLTLTIYPEKMFSGVIKLLMYTAVPAMYIAQIPVRIAKDFDLKLLLIELLVISFLTITAFFVYNKGLKKYESGN